MSKELEALARQKSNALELRETKFIEYADDFALIEQALKRNEQLTNLEKELDIDLIILFKALKNGIYTKEANEKVKFIAPSLLVFDDEYLYELKYCRNYTKLSEHNYPLYFKDYGKTWALTKEELKEIL